MLKKTAVAVTLATVLLFSTSSPLFAESIEDKKAELESVQQQLETKKVEQEAKKQEVAGAIAQLMQAQKELAAAKEELQEVQEKQNSVEVEIKQNEHKLTAKTEELVATKKLYSRRLRDIYINGQVQYLDVLLGAKDFNDFSSRMYLLQKIIARDVNLLKLLEEQKQEIENTKLALEKDKVELEKVAKEVEGKKAIVEAKTAERQKLYDQALAEQNKIDAEYNELMESSKKITAMIQNMERGGSMGAAHGTGTMMWPASGEITSPYGWRTHPIFQTSRFHAGMDIGVDYGQTIMAADSGTVIYAGWMGGYGYAVMIDHGGGVVTLYGHNSSCVVSQGETVAKGQAIALGGSTGNSTGPHCHFEVRIHGEVTDPMAYLS